MTRFAPISSRIVLSAGMVACALVASPAHAEVPSLDAYAGQALVLGKPHPQSMGGVVGARKGGANASGQAESPSRGAGSANASGQAESPSRGAGGSGTGGPASGTRVRETGSKQSRSPRGSSGSPSGAGKGANGAAYDLRAAQPAASSSDLRTAQRAANSSVLAGSDVLLLVVGVVCVAGVGAALRLSRWKRHPRPDYTQSA